MAKNRGARGLRGIPGPPGRPGATGRQGFIGKTGLRGSTGLTGKKGARGASGKAGRGSSGSPGVRKKLLTSVQGHIERIDHELDIQLRRMAMIQVQLDELRMKIKQLDDSN